MGKRIGHDIPLSSLLDLVVADGRRSAKSFFGVTGLKHTFALCVMRPHSGIAVGLQLKSYRETITLARALTLSMVPSRF